MFRKLSRLFRRRGPSEAQISRAPFYEKHPYAGPLTLGRADKLAVIDADRRFLYNRVAKAANSTIVVTLAKLALDRDVSQKKSEVLGPGAFLSPSLLSPGQVNDLDDYFKFTFVRDPYSRVLSAYLNKVVLHRRKPWNKGPTPSFAEFCHYLESGDLKPDPHFLPQTKLLVFPPERFDFIGRFERFEADFTDVLQRLGFAGAATIRFGNPSDASSKLDQYYDEPLRKVVRRLYEADFEAFRY